MDQQLFPESATTPVRARPVRVIRSARRKRSSHASLHEDGTIVVRVPDRLTQRQQDEVVQTLVARLERKLRASVITDDELLERAHRLADEYLDGIRATSVTWSSNMAQRWGSCSYESGRIRLSDRLAGAPDYVLDDVLLHELAHLVVPDHSPAFHALADVHPQHERARGFLEGLAHARSVGSPPLPN